MRQRMLLAVLIGVLAALGGIAYLNTARTTRQRPANYREAVMHMLNQYRVDYRDVVVVDGCAPSYQFCRTYAGSVQVLTATTLHGQIDCRERWTTCTLTVLQLGISGAPLDDVRDPVLARWEALYGQLMLKLQNHRWK